MYVHQTEIRVRYGETDQMKVLYYGYYAWYYEVGRVEALRSLGIVYKELEEQGTLLVVSQLSSKYIQSAHYDDLLTVRSIIRTKPRHGMVRFETEIYREHELIHVGEVTLIAVDASTRKRGTIPQSIQTALSPYFE